MEDSDPLVRSPLSGPAVRPAHAADGITQSSLTKQLRELERDGFLHREIYREIPPKVEYSLTELGRSFVPVLVQMMRWSEAHLCPPGYVSPYGDDILPLE